ncbi:MAG: M14 family zinc carboxypeptidase [Anaerolineales bacterium]
MANSIEAISGVQSIIRSTVTVTPTIVATETAVPNTQTPVPTNTPEPQTYLVREGDNLWLIAEKFKTAVTAIQLANELVNGSTIYIGQELVIPSPPNSDVQLMTPTVDVEETITPLATVSSNSSTAIPADDPIPNEKEEISTDRGVLPNNILCPHADEIEPVDGVVIGRSAVCNIPIVSYQLGKGEIPLMLIGGIHGGYEWNTIQLVYQILDYLYQNPNLIPPSLAIYLIPNANPDGLYAVTQHIGRFSVSDVAENTVPGRFNGHNVDLNRNWDCNWSPVAMWRDQPISGGNAPFSELENQFLRDYIMANKPAAVLFYHSAATGVYMSGCGEIDPASKALGEIYSGASGYPLYEEFNHYDVTGDAGDWLATKGIPSISVELSTHESLDLNINLAGLLALMEHFEPGNE